MLCLRKSRSGSIAGFALVVLAAAGISGCAAAGTGSTAAGVALSPAASMSLCNQTPGGCSAAASYSLDSMRDLAVNVQWSHVPEGTHTATFEILQPGDGLYQAQNVSFVADVADASAQTSVLVPVAGTWITQRGLTGIWTVRVSLDGTAMDRQTVTLNP
jgi:hypothetical protein